MPLKYFINLLRWSTFLILVPVINSCTKDNEFKPPEIFFDAAKSKVITIDSSGTQTTILSNGIKYTLTIPPNAIYGLDLSGSVKLTPISKIDNLPIANQFIAGIDFKADSLIFCQPLKLKIEFSDALEVNQIVCFAYDENDKTFYRFPVHLNNISSKSVTFSITHFSTYAVATGNKETNDNLITQQDEKYYSDKLEGLIIASGNELGELAIEEGNKILKDWFNLIKIPTTYKEIDNFIKQYVSWLNACTQWGEESTFNDQKEFVEEKLSTLISNEYSRLNNIFCDVTSSCEEKKNCLTEVVDLWKTAQSIVNYDIVQPDQHNFCSDGVFRFPISISMPEFSQFPKFTPVGCYCVLKCILGSVILNADDIVSWNSSDASSVSLGNNIDLSSYSIPYSSAVKLKLNKTNSSSVITAKATFLDCTLSATGTQFVVSPVASLQIGGYISPWPLHTYTMQHYAIIKAHPILVEQLGCASTLTCTNKVFWANGDDSDIIWSSSNPSYMTVDNNGLATWSRNYGSTTISATCEEVTASVYWESVKTTKNGQPQIKIIKNN